MGGGLQLRRRLACRHSGYFAQWEIWSGPWKRTKSLDVLGLG